MRAALRIVVLTLLLAPAACSNRTTDFASAAMARPGGHYRAKGSDEIRPQKLWDDGHKTYIVWGPNQALPAVFAVDDAGHEQVVDGEMRGGVYVLDSVANHLVFRLDDFLVSALRDPRLLP